MRRTWVCPATGAACCTPPTSTCYNSPRPWASSSSPRPSCSVVFSICWQTTVSSLFCISSVVGSLHTWQHTRTQREKGGGGGRQTDRQTDRDRDRQTDREKYRETKIGGGREMQRQRQRNSRLKDTLKMKSCQPADR